MANPRPVFMRLHPSHDFMLNVFQLTEYGVTLPTKSAAS
jgi:hypothetical protein